MQKIMIKWPSIEQFRNVIKNVRKRAKYKNVPVPTLTFLGTVKLHGTNAGILTNGTDVWYQSRENIITPEKDNAGFAGSMTIKEQQGVVSDLFDKVRKECAELNIDTTDKIIAIYGEWCGGSIQKSVALNQLSKMFVVFGVRIISAIEEQDDGHTLYTETYLPRANMKKIHNENEGIFNILNFPTFSIVIDFNNAQAIQNTLIELTLAVENECPVAKQFGVLGVGEGIVWAPEDDSMVNANTMFKTKGEKHSPTKVKMLVEVDVEKLNSMNEFLNATVTEDRLNQGIDKLKEQSIPVDEKATGAFIQWVIKDIIKEEKDRMEVSGVSDKELGKHASSRARQFFMTYINEHVND